MTDRRLSANLRGGARTLEAAQMPALVDTRPRALFKERAGVGQERTMTFTASGGRIRPPGSAKNSYLATAKTP